MLPDVIAKPIFEVGPSATSSKIPSLGPAMGATFIPPPKYFPLQMAIMNERIVCSSVEPSAFVSVQRTFPSRALTSALSEAPK